MTEQTPPVPARDRLILEVVRTRAENAVQVSLSQIDEDGVGFGYRLAGSKHYNMGVTTLLEEELAERDATNVRAMLDAVFPVKPRVITDPAELTSLPADSVVIDEAGHAWQAERSIGQRVEECRWAMAFGPGTLRNAHHVLAYGPVTVVHIPTEEGRDDA